LEGSGETHGMSTRPRRHVLLVMGAFLATVAMGSCSSSTTTTPGADRVPAETTPVPGYPMDDTIRINQIQALGTHNSYHRRAPKEFRDALEKVIPGITKFWDYEQPTLDEQFDEGVRQIELDVHLDPDGRYATRHALPIAGLPADAPAEMKQPGLKVFHIQEVDYDTNCLTFIACLRTVKQWSDAHPGHVPIMILVEAKADKVPDPFNMNFTQPVDFDTAGLESIDAEIRTVFGEDQMVTPDDVRGRHTTLEQAVLAGGWPTLGASRGEVMFILDNSDYTELYTAGHPSLEGRAMFTNAEPGQPDAAFVQMNDSSTKDKQDEIEALVKKGYVVRTRADADAEEARNNDTSTATAAIASGAQWVSTDFPVPDPSVSATYSVTIPGGTPARCNPWNAPAGCQPTDIENPAYLTRR
jgi:hypothetical protein